MKKSLPILLLLSVSLSSSYAQQMAPKAFVLGYHFRAGDTLHYLFVFSQIDHQSKKFNHRIDDFTQTTNSEFVIEKVDSQGNATLSITNHDKFVRPGKEQKANGFIHVIRPDMTPKSRVTVNSKGEFISGEILENEARHMASTANPGKGSITLFQMSDSGLLVLLLKQLLPPIPTTKPLYEGLIWSDTTLKTKKGQSFQMGANGKLVPGPGTEDSIINIHHYECKGEKTVNGAMCFVLSDYNEMHFKSSHFDYDNLGHSTYYYRKNRWAVSEQGRPHHTRSKRGRAYRLRREAGVSEVEGYCA